MSYKLYYFSVRGRSEVIRYLFADAGQKYEDVRLSGPTWQEFKPKAPGHQLPVLEYDGKTLAQSFAILKFVAKQLGYASGSDWEVAQMDSYLYLTNDIVTKIMMNFFEKDPEVKAKVTKDWLETTVPRYMPIYEAALETQDFLVGSKVSFADFALYDLMTRLESVTGFENYPRCIAHKERIGNRPNIVKWLKERPESSF